MCEVSLSLERGEESSDADMFLGAHVVHFRGVMLMFDERGLHG